MLCYAAETTVEAQWKNGIKIKYTEDKLMTIAPTASFRIGNEDYKIVILPFSINFCLLGSTINSNHQ